VRYPTAGCDSASEAQPFYVNAPYGICLAHNGNLTNAAELAEVLIREDRRHLNTESDSEVLLNVFASELQRVGTPRVTPADIFAAASAVYRRCRGGYAGGAMVIGHGVLGFRDPNGIRPLVLGQRARRAAPSTCWPPRTSRSTCCPSSWCATWPRRGGVHRRAGPAAFAAVRGHRAPYAVHLRVRLLRAAGLDHRQHLGVSARMRMGEKLAARRSCASIPTTTSTWSFRFPTPAAPARCRWRRSSGIKYREGFTKNRYIGRTFIMPGQEQRERSVRRKLNAIDLEFRGKNVLLVDDSIVRGTTSAQIIDLAREAGAKKVYFASAAPPVRFPNVYGIDMPATSELVAAGQRRGSRAVHRRRLADLPGSRGSGEPPASTTTPRSRNSTPRASPASTSPAM
jgi:amidophosphoribosyltransferase